MNLFEFLVMRGFHSIRMETGKLVSLEFINSKDYKFVNTSDDETFVFRGKMGKVEIFFSYFTEKNIFTGEFYTSGNITIGENLILCDFISKSDYQKVRLLFPSLIKERSKKELSTRIRFSR